LTLSKNKFKSNKGIMVDGVMGKDPKAIRMTWVRTVYAIYNLKK